MTIEEIKTKLAKMELIRARLEAKITRVYEFLKTHEAKSKLTEMQTKIESDLESE